jgi:mannose-6-phosphate isomerase-like protein (cupin superfamily)
VASKTHLVSLPSEGRSLSMGGLGVIYKVLGEDTGGALVMVEHPIEPERLVRPHGLTNMDEIWYVVEGDIVMKVREELLGE